MKMGVSLLQIKEERALPSVSQSQQRLMGADLARAKAGEKTRTGMSESKLKEFASTKRNNLPFRKKALRSMMKKGE